MLSVCPNAVVNSMRTFGQWNDDPLMLMLGKPFDVALVIHFAHTCKTLSTCAAALRKAAAFFFASVLCSLCRTQPWFSCSQYVLSTVAILCDTW